jgi:hypothetical protein
MADTFKKTVDELAEAHRQVVGADLDIRAMPDAGDNEIRLVEIHRDFIPIGEVWPLSFGADDDFPYRLTVIQLTPEEWRRVEDPNDDTMTLTNGFDVKRLERLALESAQP